MIENGFSERIFYLLWEICFFCVFTLFQTIRITTKKKTCLDFNQICKMNAFKKSVSHKREKVYKFKKRLDFSTINQWKNKFRDHFHLPFLANTHFLWHLFSENEIKKNRRIYFSWNPNQVILKMKYFSIISLNLVGISNLLSFC